MFRSRSLKSRLLSAILAVGAAAGLSVRAVPKASAASLTQIANFGSNPSGLAPPGPARSARVSGDGPVYVFEY